MLFSIDSDLKKTVDNYEQCGQQNINLEQVLNFFAM